MVFEVHERNCVHLCGSEHFSASCAGVQLRASRRAAASSTFFANQSRAFAYCILSCSIGPIVFFVCLFASGTFDQGLALCTIEPCMWAFCFGIFNIRAVEHPASHAFAAVFAVVVVHVSRHVAVVLASYADEQSMWFMFVVFNCHFRPCIRREFLHARRTSVHVCVALFVRKFFGADVTNARTCLWLSVCGAYVVE